MSQLPNQRCACGSGKKFKKCCMSSGMRNLTDEEWAARRKRGLAARLAACRLESDLEAMLATVMFSPAMERMRQEQDDRAALAELQAAVDSIKAGDTIDVSKLRGVSIIRA